ncbi:Uncharacterised protein [Mycobacteroides abscessus subsp. abscessus]|nr:Uncharacterised protein [Mycobacteroides abscessus subsp. abscessus]
MMAIGRGRAISAMKSKYSPVEGYSTTCEAMVCTPSRRPAMNPGVNTSRTVPLSSVWSGSSAKSMFLPKPDESRNSGACARSWGLASGSLIIEQCARVPRRVERGRQRADIEVDPC